MERRICITGIGLCSPIGNDPESFAHMIDKGVTGIRQHESIFEGLSIWAGLVDEAYSTEARFGIEKEIDRASELAIFAANQAWRDAFGDGPDPRPERVGLVLGTSHGGRSQLDQCVQSPDLFEDGRGARKILLVSPHHHQTDVVANELNIHGPVATISSACSSSGAALAFAFELLAAGKADHVLAGGVDGLSKLTYAGFRALGAVADAPCGPFSQTVGITLGEGAAVMVLETLETARKRGARIHAEILGCGSSWDGYHITEPDPTGEGILRAAKMAINRAGIGPESIDYVNVHGTGTRASDGAETIALQRLFEASDNVPPASSTKSFTGHTLGASAAMGLISATIAVKNGRLPPTVNFTGPRPGCDLDFVPNHARSKTIRHFSCQSAGFGGVNTVVIGGQLDDARPQRRGKTSRVGITGIGIISSIGLNATAFRQSLREGVCGVGGVVRFGVEGCRSSRAALVRGFDARRIIPSLNLRRADLAIQYAAAAAAQAMRDAATHERGLAPERVGLVIGTTRGASSSFQNFLNSTLAGVGDKASGANWQSASALHFPNLVMSSVGGYVSKALMLRGMASTLVGGTGCGMQTVIHAFELLRQNNTQDAVVVVMTDEIAPLYFRLFDQLGILATADSPLGEVLAPYQAASSGTVLGEGAVAFVLESLDGENAREVATYGEIKGYGWTADAAGYYGTSPGGEWLESAMASALEEASLGASDIDVLYGHGRGLPCHDFREVRAARRLFGPRVLPVSCVIGNTGLSEAASGGFSVAAALLGMQSGEAYPVMSYGQMSSELNFVCRQPLEGDFKHALVAGSTDNGNNAALVLSRGTRLA